MPFLKKGGGEGKKTHANALQITCSRLYGFVCLFLPLGCLAPSLASKSLTFPGDRVKGVCKCGFSSGPRFEVQGAEQGTRTRGSDLAAPSPEPCRYAKSTCLWRHLVAERQVTGAGPDDPFRASHWKCE